METSYSAVLDVVKLGEGGMLEVLVFQYTKYTAAVRGEGKVPTFSCLKLPVETAEPNETPWLTASNGAHRELSSTPDSPNGFKFSSPDILPGGSEPVPFITCRVLGDPGKGGEFHDKHVFLIHLGVGAEQYLRTTQKWDGPLELLDPPVFVEAGELWRRMLERGQPFHRAVLFKTIERFARDPAVYERYHGILDDKASQDAMKSRGAMVEFTENPDLF